MEAVPYSQLPYRYLECSKILSLKHEKGNFDAPFKLSSENITEIVWWINNIENATRSLISVPVDYTIYTDASKIGWGAKDHLDSTGGQWLGIEKEKHINILEIKAVLFALKALVQKPYKHIRIMTDNTTMVAYINKMEGT